jgi:glutamine amidotransferase
MNALQATILDAGVGNLGNLERALCALGAAVTITHDPDEVSRARCLLLPGVGAFRPPRETLRGALEEALKEALSHGACLLGICVGYQLLFEASDEFGETDGLALLPGRIEKLPPGVPLPHIGWNALESLRPHALLDGIAEGGYAYFVHSYAPAGLDREDCLARCRHGRAFPAVAARGRVLGTQFHPEKSGRLGLTLLGNFLEISRAALAGD